MKSSPIYDPGVDDRHHRPRAAFPTASYVLRVGIALALTAAGGSLSASLLSAWPAIPELLRLAVGGTAGVAAYPALVLGLRLIPAEEARAAGRWFRRRLAPVPTLP